MRILIITPSYSEEKRSAYAFVHARSKTYEKFGNKVKVFVPSQSTYKYRFEGIDVYRGADKVYNMLLTEFDPDIVAIHSLRYTFSKNPLKMLDRTRKQAPIVIWIHGTEALINAFHHYFPPWSLRAKAKNVLGGTLKITILRFLIPKASAIVHVSKWMKNTAERYLMFRHPYSFIIPNPVDTDLFTYKEGNRESRNRGISVRGLEWKYGIDIAIKAYSRLKGTNLTILGTGPLDNYLRSLSRKCQSNVTFVNTHIEHNKMPELYSAYGYFVAPSRTEAQGVAMCEAMACGLPVIATNVGGIPEFIKSGTNGILVTPENQRELRKAVKLILADQQFFDTLSKNGARYVRQHLSYEEIYKKEFNVFKLCRERFDAESLA